MASATVELWIVWDSVGDCGIGRDMEAARASYESDIQPIAEAEGFRSAKILLAVPLPELVEIEGEIPDTEGEPTLAVA